MVIIFSIGGILIGEGDGPLAPFLASPMMRKVHKNLVMGNSIRLLLAILLLDLLQLGTSFAETFLSKIFLPIFQKIFFQLSKLKNGRKMKL